MKGFGKLADSFATKIRRLAGGDRRSRIAARIIGRSNQEHPVDSSPDNNAFSVVESHGTRRRTDAGGRGASSADDSTPCADAETVASAKASVELICPNGHDLTAFAVGYARGYTCDIEGCGRHNFFRGDYMFGCRMCNWDMCADCAGMESLECSEEETITSLLCPNGHPLTEFITGSLGAFDMVNCEAACRRRNFPHGKVMFGCGKCHWALCRQCAESTACTDMSPFEFKVHLKRLRQNDTTLTDVDMGDWSLGNGGAKLLGSALAANTVVKCISLSWGKIDSEGAGHLARALQRNNTLEQFTLKQSQIGKVGARHFAHTLRSNVSLRKLHLTSNGIGDKGAAHLAEALPFNTTLKILTLTDNKIGPNGARELAKALSRTHLGLQELDLGSNQIGGVGARHLAGALHTYTALRKLSLFDNSIGDEGAKHVAKLIKINTSLHELRLGANNIWDEGAGHLACALQCNNTIRVLSLCRNEIGTEGAGTIADALQHCNLLALELESDQIGPEGAGFFAYALTFNVSLTALNLQNNGVGDEGARYIIDALRSNTVLSDLVLQDNGIGDDGARHIGNSLETNQILSNLNIGGNAISNTGAQYIASGLRLNRSLCELKLDYDDISTDLETTIKSLVHTNSVKRLHEEGTQKEGVSYFIALRQNADESGPAVPSVQWHSPRVRDAMGGDGRALVAVLRVLKGAVAVAQKRENETLDLPAAPEGLIRALGDKNIRKALADSILDGKDKSTMLHLAAAAEDETAVHVCQILVESFNADFDNITDELGRSARTIALANDNPDMIAWASQVGTLLGRYRVDQGPLVHKSATCKVVFATDVVEGAVELRRVALKLITKRVHFEHELRVRLIRDPGSGVDISPDSNRFDESQVINLHRYHDEIGDNGKPVMCLVMPAADRNVDIIIRSENVASRELYLIKHLAVRTAKALAHLHSAEHGMIHADLKPRNIVRMGSSFRLIDFDSSIKIGESVAVDKISTAYCPPELAKVLFACEDDMDSLLRREQEIEADLGRIKSSIARALVEEELAATEDKIKLVRGGVVEPPKALPSFDVWSFGVVLFYLLTGSPLFRCNNADNLDSIEEQKRLAQWNGLRDDQLLTLLADSPDATNYDIRAAADLLRKCLKANPSDRPQSMKEVLSMPFLNSSMDDGWTPGEKNSVNVLFSDPLVFAQDGALYPIDRLHFARERNLLAQCLRGAQRNIQLTFDAATVERLQDLSSIRCGCLHFSGHGATNYLLFEDGSGGAHFVSNEGLQKLLSHNGFKLVVVSACNSEPQGQAFVHSGVPHVICCEQDEFLCDDAATKFTRSFYSKLIRGSTLQAAFESARGAVFVSHGEEESNKYILLPPDADHDVSIFDLDKVECDREYDVQQLSLSAPSYLYGHQIAMYQLVSMILSDVHQKHIITLVGEKGLSRDKFVAAVCYYVKDRLSTTLNIDEMYYIARHHTKPSSECWLQQLYQQMLAQGKTKPNSAESVEACVIEAVSQSKILIVLDGLEKLDDETHVLLTRLCARPGTLKCLLIFVQENRAFSFPVEQTKLYLPHLLQKG